MNIKLNDRIYQILKWVVCIVLPAISGAYFGLAQIWHWGYAEQICGTIAIIETFIGALIGVSTKAYYKEKESDDEKEGKA